MQFNKAKLLASTFAVVVLVGGAAPAFAADWLQCQRVKDSFGTVSANTFSATFDLAAIQAPFPAQAGCELRRARTKEVCTPTAATRTDSGGTPNVSITGLDLTNEFHCYRIKCPKLDPGLPDLIIGDNFGERTFTKVNRRLKKVCVPAFNAYP